MKEKIIKLLKRINYVDWFTNCFRGFIIWGLLPMAIYIFFDNHPSVEALNIFSALGLTRFGLALMNPPMEI